MTASCTIVIPTHNRPHYLQRCTRWFLDLGYDVIIADSSTEAWSCALRDNPKVRYIHHPGGFDVYLRKLQIALAVVETPLVAMCADDDFITGAGLEASTAFLTANPDYAFCQGYSYIFQAFGSRVVIWPTQYLSHEVAEDSWLDRVESAKDTLYYGMHRTAVLCSAIDFLAERDFGETFDSAMGFFDWCILKTVAKAGKLKRLPVPFGLREYSPTVSVVGTRYLTITSHNIPDFHAAFITFLLIGDTSPDARTRLMKMASLDYADQLIYDWNIKSARKKKFAFLPERMVTELEYFFRLYASAVAFCTKGFLRSAKIFWMPEYHRFRRLILPSATTDGGWTGE